MVDPKSTNKKAQEILKSLQSNYDDSGNMTVEYFETLEKDIFDWKRRLAPKKTDAPAPIDTSVPKEEPKTPPVAGPQPPAPVAEKPQRPEVRQQPTVTSNPPVDAMHQARTAVSAQPQAQQGFLPKTHALDKIKRMMEAGSVNEKGEMEISPEQASFTLAPIQEFFDNYVKDDESFMEVMENLGDFAKDRATDPNTGIVNPQFNGRAIQIVKQSLAKKLPATDAMRAHLMKRYNTLIPFSEAEKRADPVIEAMTREFNQVVSGKDMPEMKDKIRMKSLGTLVGQKYLKYINQEYMNLDNRQLSKVAETPVGTPIKRKQPDGRMVAMPVTEEDVQKAAHELRVRQVIQTVQEFMWNNYGITTYLGGSMFGNSDRAQSKRAKDIPRLQMTAEQLTSQIEESEKTDLGKSAAVVFDSSEFPEDEKPDFVVKR